MKFISVLSRKIVTVPNTVISTVKPSGFRMKSSLSKIPSKEQRKNNGFASLNRNRYVQVGTSYLTMIEVDR